MTVAKLILRAVFQQIAGPMRLRLFTRKQALVLGAGLLATAGMAASPLSQHLAAQPSDTIQTNDVVRRVWDSRLWQDSMSRPIFWVDDSTILVATNKDPQPQTPQEMRERTPWLYLWRLGETPRSQGTDPRKASVFYCAARGQVSYHYDLEGGGRTRWLGVPGQEVQTAPVVRPSAGVSGNRAELIEPIDCEIFADPSMKGQIYFTDSERKYYLGFGKSGPDSSEPLTLTRADGSGRIELPVRRGTVSSPTYRLFDRAFLLYDRTLAGVGGNLRAPAGTFAEWRDTDCLPIWRVEPESAKTERICVPYGPWTGNPAGRNGAVFSFFPTRAGYFFSYNRSQSESGLYQLQNQTVRRVVEGNVRAAVVSPNGCRIAFEFTPTDAAQRSSISVPATIVAIDVCS